MSGYHAAMEIIGPAHWFLKEWLAKLGRTPAWLEDQTGWTHRITNQLVNRKLRWNQDHLTLAAKLLEIPPHELLIPPAEAEHIRRLRDAAADEMRFKLAEEQKAFAPPLPDQGNLRTRKRRIKPS